MKYILTDVEGTTTSISFVHEVLFPYSKSKIKNFILDNQENENIKNILNNIEGPSVDLKISTLLTWIEEDKKEKPLKDLQGLIWDIGYTSGELKGHVYPEVKDALIKWKNLGMSLGVYSSGSIKAQKLIFKHSIAGDLDQYFSNNFDTSIGHKREKSSYLNIVKELNIPANEILFLSDIKEELDAAKLAGMNVIQLVRQENVILGNHPKVANFMQIKF